MTSQIRSITIDCTDPARLAHFWEAVLGYRFEDSDDEAALIVDPAGQCSRLLFLRVPEGKAVKNRVHFDLKPEDTMAAEVERLLALGARRSEAFRDMTGWTVLEDLEGNEFCVEQGPGDRK